MTYPRPALTVDMVVIDNSAIVPSVLLILRRKAPFADCWALPGGFVEEHEDLLDAALRETAEETGLKIDKTDESLYQIGAFGKPHRDPRGWTVTVAFSVEGSFMSEQLTADDDAADAQWFALDALPPLAFDHKAIIDAAWTIVA